MSRQAFEDWANANRLPFSGAPKGTQFSYDAKLVWQAATNAALEMAAEVCDHAEVFAWEQRKATGNQHTEGVSDGAASLALHIRALKDEK